ncbi:hypothetical protein [Roseiflexus sp.]
MMIAGVFDDPGAGIDWIALIQITLAFALLSVCCWLIGVTLQARRQHRHRQRRAATETTASDPTRQPAAARRQRCCPLTDIDPLDADHPSDSARRRSITGDLS